MNATEGHEEPISLEKMKKWGVVSETFTHKTLPDVSRSELIVDPQLMFRNWVVNYSRAFAFRKDRTALRKLDSLEATCRELRSRVRKLEALTDVGTELTRADAVYELSKNELESKYLGKIVAIDVDSKQIVGIGDSILEAYKEARKQSSKATFAYRRVGFPYVHQI